MSRLSDKYDYYGVLWLGVLKLLAKIHVYFKEKADNWQKSKDYFCSELCFAAFYTGGGLDIVPEVAAADITSPGDIARSGIIEKVT